MATIWELDFYSRPLLDDQQKKVWEALICETPQSLEQNDGALFRYSQLCSSSSVNSLWLKAALEEALAQSGQAPQKVRFFRRQMNNMITKACEEAGLTAVPSRRTHELERWLQARLKDFYPQQTGYDPQWAQAGGIRYPELSAADLPDAARGDRGDRWALVSLELDAFADLPEWEIGFGETLPLFGRGLAPDARIPGLILFSPRALAFAAWLSGLELGYLALETEPRPFLSLETGASDRWILANLTDPQTLEEARSFERAKEDSQGLHFLALQTSPETEAFAGFWLLQTSAGLG